MNKNKCKTYYYKNSALEKVKILEDNIKERGVYCWINNINNKIYVGSSINLTTRFYKYYSLRYLNNTKTPICNAFKKYGFNNFSLVILEYLKDNKNLIKREQYYLDLLKPEYNILKKAGSSLGYKHKEETLQFFRKERILSEEARKNLSLAATGRILSKEVKDKISSKRKGMKMTDITRLKLSESAAGIKVNVININTNEKLEFKNLTTAAKYIGVSRTAVSKALKKGNLIKKIFKIEII